MKRQFNPRFFLIGLAVVVALAGCVHLVHAYMIKSNAKAFLRQADEYEKAGNHGKVVECLARYVNLCPDDVDEYCHYAKEFAQNNDSNARSREEALFLLYEALRRQPERDDIRREALKVSMSLGRFRDGVDLATALKQKSPNDSELLEQLAVCEDSLAGTTRPDHALLAYDHYNAAIGKDPKLVDGYVRLSHLVRRYPTLFPGKNSDKIMEDLTKNNANDYQAFLARAAYLRDTRKQPEEASKDIAKAELLAPDNAAVLLAVADDARDNGNGERAQKALEKGLHLYPQDIRFRFGLVQADMRADKSSEARKLLLEVQSNQPKDMSQQTLWALTDLLIDVGETGEARKNIARLRQLKSDPGVIDYLEAHCLLASEDKKRFTEAMTLLGRSRARLAVLPELARRSDLLVNLIQSHLGNPEDQEARLKNRLQHEPGDLETAFALARVKLALGKVDEALLLFSPQLLDRFPEARLVFARLLIGDNLRLSAEKRAEGWVKVMGVLKPEKNAKIAELSKTVEYHVVEIELLVARALTERELAMQTALTTCHRLQFEPTCQKLAAANTLLADATRLITELRTKAPKEVRYILIQASLIEITDPVHRADSTAEALKVLKTATKELGNGAQRADLRLALVTRDLSRATQAEAIAKLLEAEKDTANWPQTEHLLLLRGLAAMQTRYNNSKDVRRLLTEIKALDPGDLLVHLQLFDLAVQLDDFDGAAKVREEMRAIEEEGSPLGLYADAYLLLRRYEKERNEADLNQARVLLTEIAKRRPSWSRVHLIRGDFAELEGDLWTAGEEYKAAVLAGEHRFGVVRKALELLLSQYRIQDARIVSYVAQGTGNGPGAQRLDNDLLILRGGTNTALERAEEFLQADPRNPFNHLWLAQIALAANNKERAEKALREAVKLNNKAPETWVALIVFLATDFPERKAEARKELDNARAALKEKPALLSQVLAPAYEALGDLKEAETQYLLLDTADAKDLRPKQNLAVFYLRTGQTDKSEKLLRDMIGKTDNNLRLRMGQIRWARRTLAVQLALSGDFKGSQEASVLLNLNRVTRDSIDVDDERAWSLVNAVRPGERNLSIERLEKARHSRNLSTEEILFLVHLHEANHNDSKAKIILLDLADREEKENPFVLGYFIRFLLRTHKLGVGPYPDRHWRDDLGLANEYLVILKRIRPGAAETVELEARLLAANENGVDVGKAVALLKNWADQQYLQYKDPRTFAVTASVMEELEDSYKPAKERTKPETENLLRRYMAEAEARPTEWKKLDAPLALVYFLGKNQKLSEALDLLVKVAKDCTPESVASTGVAVLRANPLDPKESARVQDLIKPYLDKKPNSEGLLLSMADLRDAEKEYDQALRLYQRVIQINPDNMLALNNCAFLLAMDKKSNGEALAMIKHAIDRHGPQGVLLDTRGLILLKMGDAPGAIRDFTDAIDQAPDYGRWFHLAQAQAIAKPDDAKPSMMQARKLTFQRNDVHPLEEPERERLDKVLK